MTRPIFLLGSSLKNKSVLLVLKVIGLVWVIVAVVKQTHLNSFTLEKLLNNHGTEREIRKRYNLIDGSPKLIQECTVELMNANKLEQDHPCVVEMIRSKFMIPPAAVTEPYQLDDPREIMPILMRPKLDADANHLLKNKSNGFFVEAGALDGQRFSNSLLFERDYNYTGLLIEGNPTILKKLVARKRKAWILPVCISMEVFPSKVLFQSSDVHVKASAGFHIVEKDSNGNKIFNKKFDSRYGGQIYEDTTEVQCFPLYSILLAANRTCVDYLSLDVEGSEMRILSTIPWERVDIKVLRIEYHRVAPKDNLTSEQVLDQYMEGEPGYTKYTSIFIDSIYFKNGIII